VFVDFSIYEMDGKLPDWVPEFKRCQKWMEAALECAYGTFNIIDIADMMFTGDVQLWANDTAVLVTQIVHYPRKAVLNAFLAGGDMDGVLRLEHTAVLWGKQNRCQAITLTGRPGWSRSQLRDIGYVNVNVQMTKEI
jgi:hypothetical protein